ncbi:MAG: LacI family DNA-binding transcriptional regulator, partial [Desulfobacteraceae bacterium]|nr:LacI family DNA-binding transcriptional regulator [Desulfobacteraceae bacterium]
ATVSRVLNNTAVVNKETRKRVLGVIEELKYTPSFIAKGMRRKKTNTFGVIIPDFRNPYYSEFLKAIEDEARKHEYIALICTGEMNADRERAYIDYLLSRQIEGLILCCYVSIMENRSFIQDIAKKVPIIVMDQPSFNMPVSAVYADGYKGFKKLLTYLIEKGHKKIGMIRSLHKYPCSESRFVGYMDTLKENDISIDQNLIEESEFTAAGGYEAAKRLLGRSKPTAIVGVNDLITIGALKYIRERGYSVPDEIAIAGFDNIALSSLVSPQLTTVNIPVEKIAVEAINQLIKKIMNVRARNKDIVIETELVIRQSTEKVKKDEILM